MSGAGAGTRRVPNVLSIAGSDPSGGAGIQADLRTFAALGVYGSAAVAALTAQNTVEVSAVMSVPPDFLRRQIDSVFEDVRIDAVKIGMLGSAETVVEVARALRRWQPPVVVLDPVMRATSGGRLIDPDAVGALRDELLPLATVVTPNAIEAGALIDAPAPSTVAEAREVAARIVGAGARAALVTGGHVDPVDGDMVDVLHDGTSPHELRVPRADGGTHGSGCTLASAIAAFLALGHPLREACARAQRVAASAIAAGRELEVGRGEGPVWQVPGVVSGNHPFPM